MSDLKKASNLYTTGELAKLCGVTVRTVQYYDTRGILVPSELSEGGRRLYSEEDLQKMKIICFLRGIGLPIDSIGKLFAEENPGSVISILLEQQKQLLKDELNERQVKLQTLEELSRELKKVDCFAVESIGDIAYRMENKKNLCKVRVKLIIVGIIIELIEAGLLALWIAKGIWWPFAIGWIVLVLPLALWISGYYFKNVDYICPQCHAVFRPRFKEAFWARHTPNTRRLTCVKCGHKGFCVETYHKEEVAEKSNRS